MRLNTSTANQLDLSCSAGRVSTHMPRLEAFVQPKVELRTGRVLSHELLVRPGRNAGSAERFYAELREGSIPDRIAVEIDALKMAELVLSKNDHKALSVNVSWLLLESTEGRRCLHGLIERVSSIGAQLTVELLEGDRVSLESAKTIVVDLAKKGVRIAIDDFGKGFSSLSIACNLPVLHEVKFDGSLIRSERASTVLPELVSMAHKLGAIATAECVESAADLDLVRRMGFDHAQGYYFGFPRHVAV